MTMTQKQLTDILAKHAKWLRGEEGGERAHLSGADLSGANLRDAHLRGADLRDAHLRGADLRGADLSGANLRDAHLRGADLRGADLSGANLSGANLRDAHLRGADLRGADLSGANLRGADLDYSAWPLWCGSLGVKVDVRIARQLAYHLCRLECEEAEYKQVVQMLKPFANQFHRAEECGRIE